MATESRNDRNEPDGSFVMKDGRTTYEIGIFFSKTSKETLDDKVKRLIMQDVKAGNF
ncbi:MAG: transposon-encoded TnpW family protein [Lachnospiraceae bacterium]|nr:transposon-encoded TnpW family protein [Lachnospiraceae bacterium]